jgi:hypothetical protein
MDRVTYERRTPQRMISVLRVTALVAGMLAVLAPGANAAVNTCKAKNLTKGTPVDTHLQRVIRAASPGDTISVKYVCVGNFNIGKDLTLVGKSTPGMAKAVLNANGTGRTLYVSAQVRLTNLKVTGGNLINAGGGGIVNVAGILTLKDTVVSGNTGLGGGGIYNPNGSTLIMNGSSSVNGNTVPDGSSYSGGGIFNYYGTLIMNGSSSVNGNTAPSGGGISSYGGTVTLKDSSSVSGNTALHDGGILTGAGEVNGCNATGVNEWIGTVEPNSPNDFLDSDVTLITC